MKVLQFGNYLNQSIGCDFE